MGRGISLPIQRQPLSYECSEMYTCTGQPKMAHEDSRQSHDKRPTMSQLTEHLFHEVLETRTKLQQAKLKIRNLDNSALRREMPNLTDERINSLRDLFLAHDLNRDGVIDFLESGMILDNMGDETPADVRLRHFSRVDDEGYGALDFQQYVKLICNLTDHPQTSHTSAPLSAMSVISVGPSTVRKCTLYQQLDYGLV